MLNTRLNPPSWRVTKKIDTVILAGSGRSGTTWIGRILAASPMTRLIFEPLHREEVAEAAHLPTRPYARADADYPELAKLFDRLLAGEMASEWLGTQRSGKRQIVKTIRATLLLAWLSEQYRLPIIYVTRHPCAVVNSRVKLGWQTHLDGLLTQRQLVDDWLAPYESLIANASSAIERHAVMWCVENMIPLRQQSAFNWAFATYEGFVADSLNETGRLLDAIGWRRSLWTRRAIGQVSPVARPDSAVVQGKSLLTDWQRQLGKDDIRTILDTVATFGITLYNESPYPIELS